MGSWESLEWMLVMATQGAVAKAPSSCPVCFISIELQRKGPAGSEASGRARPGVPARGFLLVRPLSPGVWAVHLLRPPEDSAGGPQAGGWQGRPRPRTGLRNGLQGDREGEPDGAGWVGGSSCLLPFPAAVQSEQ